MKFHKFLENDKAVKNAKELIRLVLGSIFILMAVVYLVIVNKPSFQEIMSLLTVIMAFIAGQQLSKGSNE